MEPQNRKAPRVDIQVLRALAVLMVVFFHLWPSLIPGGYVGVDVFFVISGFLISAHLIRELRSTKRIDFYSFYARRIKRLMPLALTVLLTVTVCTFLFLPWSLWHNTANQIVSSVLGYQNWFLAAESVDYFASTNQPSPVQHFWSLSLEEQFYVLWPMYLFVGFVFLSKTNRLQRLPLLFISIALLSFVISIQQTTNNQTIAYFSTFTHIWEFALGGLAALYVERQKLTQTPDVYRLISVAAGVLFICFSAFAFNSESPFPGYIALIPSIGVILVLLANRGRDSLEALPELVKKPVVWIGDNSYGIYLWHWPLIVFVPVILQQNLDRNSKIGVLILTFALAAFTTKYIEKPFRFTRSRYSTNKFVYPIAFLAVSTTFGFAIALMNMYTIEETRANQLVNQAFNEGAVQRVCLGAEAMSNLNKCSDPYRVLEGFGPEFASQDWGTLPEIQKDRLMIQPGYCVNVSRNSEPVYECALGQVGSNKKIGVIGDSHAFALLEPLVALGKLKGYEVRAYLHDSCSPLLPDHIDIDSSPCDKWRSEVADYLETDTNLNAVIFTGFSRGELGTENSQLIKQYSNLYSKIAKEGKEIFVIGDVPLTGGKNIPECVASSISMSDPCASEKKEALGWDPSEIAVKTLHNPKIKFVDITKSFCDSDTCHAVVGGIIAYRDDHHASGRFAQTLLSTLKNQINLQ